MSKLVGVLVGVVVVLGCAVGVLRAPGVLTDVRILPPAPSLAPRLAGFSGVWESTQGRPRQLVVERINETWAMIVNVWADESPDGATGGWERVAAHVLRDGTVRWGYPARFTLRVAEAGVVLEREGMGAPERILLRKARTLPAYVTVGPEPAPVAGDPRVRHLAAQ